MTEEKLPDYQIGQQIFESLEGVAEKDKFNAVLLQLGTLYPERAGQMFQWWVQAREAGLFEEKQEGQ